MEINLKKDYKFWITLLIVILVICFVSFYRIKILNMDYIAAHNPTTISDKFNKTYEAKEEGNELGQSFVSKFNNLEKIFIKFDVLKVENSYLATGGDATIRFKR